MAKRKIVWSHRSKIKLFEILQYYSERNKSEYYSRKLYKKITKSTLVLAEKPNLGHKTDFDSIRCLIVGRFTIFYKVMPSSIIIHLVWDNRQDPENLKLK